jgi:WD40 repeat protein
LEGHLDWVMALAVLPDGRLASGSYESKEFSFSKRKSVNIRIWDPATGNCLGVFKGYQGVVVSLAVLPDGRLASGCKAHRIVLRDLASGCWSAIYEAHLDDVVALAVFPDGRLASGSRDKTIRLWDPAFGSCFAVLEGHEGGVEALAVLPDGRLASGSSDKTIRLWDPAFGSCFAVLEGHEGGVNALAVLPDGRLASCSSDCTIRIWDPTSRDAGSWVLFVGDTSIITIHVQPVSVQGSDIASGATTGHLENSPVSLAGERCRRVAAALLAALHRWNLVFSRCPTGTTCRDNAAPAMTPWIPHPTRPLLVAGDDSGRLHCLELPAPSRPTTV